MQRHEFGSEVARLCGRKRGVAKLAMNSLLVRTSRISLFAIVSALAFPAHSSAQTPKRANPTSKLYVAEVKGTSSVDDGKSVKPLAKDGVVAPEGSIFETKPNSNDSFVLSNGTAMFVDSDTRFEVKRFMQEPFTPNRNDLEIEPSVSQIVIHLNHGSVGLCTARLLAGSSMAFQTPQATINIRGRRLMIQSDDKDTRVSLLEGDLTVIGDPAKGGEVLRPGQQAVVHKESPDGPATVTVTTISEEETAKLDELVSLACISRRTVFFESVPRSGNGTTGESDLVPVRTTPGRAPTQFTVSPARVNQ